MAERAPQTEEMLARAVEARKAGRPDEARSLLEAVVAADPKAAPAWNMLGLLQLAGGQIPAAIASFEAALSGEAKPPVLWFNLARAHAAAGDVAAELASLDQALAGDAYFLPALLAKGRALLNSGREAQAVALYRAFLGSLPPDSSFPAEIQAQLRDARELVRIAGERRAESLAGAVEQVAEAHPGADLRRAIGFVEHSAGRRKVFVQQPTSEHFPYLPAIEFFDRGLFPWFEALEAQTETIRAELLSLWAEEEQRFRPYVTFDATAPVNQWAELNHSLRWSAWFFWKDGVRDEANCARCPATAAAVDALPLLDIPGKGPTVMFSVLQPKTRIPPHTGSSNARTTIHLPLVVPEGCGFRVGSETRQWRVGEAWAFDDTIEHEAWNDIDQPRAILIVDGWNPLLSEAERAVVRLVSGRSRAAA